MTKKISTGLGKGLGALLPNIEFSDKGFKFVDEEDEKLLGGSIALIEVSKITFNPYQPRRDFESDALESLKNSILENGIIQPITVQKLATGYQLISGERRLRATIAGGLTKIPAYIITTDTPIDSLVLALIENLLREDLNPIEIANGYQRLIEEFNYTQEQVAMKFNRDRTTVTNFLRLLKLPDQIQDSLRKKEISMGQARALLAISTPKKMLLVWKEIVEKQLSVRAVETLVKDIESGKFGTEKEKTEQKQTDKTDKEKKTHISEEISLVLADAERRLRHIFGTNVRIHTKSKESGHFEFEFYSIDDFERLIELFINAEKDNS